MFEYVTQQDRRAEQAAIDGGTPVEELMERAGAALAEAIWLHAGSRSALFLCGPGNNGGDGYVAARHLKARGVDVQVAAMADPSSDAAKWARGKYDGDVIPLDEAKPAPVLVDCLFGTGLSRGLDEELSNRLASLADEALISIACDLPSGWLEKCEAFLCELETIIPDYHALLTTNAIFIKRAAGIGVLPADRAASYGCTGPVLRGSPRCRVVGLDSCNIPSSVQRFDTRMSTVGIEPCLCIEYWSPTRPMCSRWQASSRWLWHLVRTPCLMGAKAAVRPSSRHGAGPTG